jgi:hypothetical protein
MSTDFNDLSIDEKLKLYEQKFDRVDTKKEKNNNKDIFKKLLENIDQIQYSLDDITIF